MNNDGGPAFPETRWDDKTRQEVQWCGMTLRDYFAAKALSGLLSDSTITAPCISNTPEGIEKERREFAQEMAKSAYRFADAMLAERDK
jgi:hypothetical protein